MMLHVFFLYALRNLSGQRLTVFNEFEGAGEAVLGHVFPVGQKDEGQGLVERDAWPRGNLAAEPAAERRLDQRLGGDRHSANLREQVHVLMEAPAEKERSEFAFRPDTDA